MLKSFRQLRGDPESPVLEEALESQELTKFNALVRAGLADKAEVVRLKRALGKDSGALTKSDKDLMIKVFHGLLDRTLHNTQLFQKTKQTYATEDMMDESIVDISSQHGYQAGDPHELVHHTLNTKGYKRTSNPHDYEYEHPMTHDKLHLMVHDHRVFKTYKLHNEAKDPKDEIHNFAFPVLLLLRRKAIRLFPDGKKVGLYYADKLARYFSVPSTGDAIAEEVIDLEETELTEAESKGGPPKPPKSKINPTAPKSGLKSKAFSPSPNGEHASGVMQTLTGIVQNQESAQIKFLDGSRLKVDMLTAHAILTVYDRLSQPENKVRFDKMLNKNNACFMKILAFCHKHYISGQQNQPG